MSKCVVLIGIKHSGKTTTGTQLAKQLSVPFFDIDHVIEQQTGRTCRDIFAKDGFEAFKHAELEACKYICDEQQNIFVDGRTKSVISAGGGICENEQALEILKAIGVFIYLDISCDIAFERIVENSKRTGSFPATLGIIDVTPLNVMQERFSQQYTSRTEKYLALADITVKMDDLTKDEIIQKIITETNF